MVARSRNGETKAFPVVETIHKDNICHTTEAPARVPQETIFKAQQVAQQAVECLEGKIRVSACDTMSLASSGLWAILYLFACTFTSCSQQTCTDA